MRSLYGFFLLPVLVSSSSLGCAKTSPSSTYDATEAGNPNIVIEASEMAWAAELYDALDVEPAIVDHPVLTIHRKEVGGLSCRQMMVEGANPTSPATVQHACEVQANLSQSQIREIFSKLDVPLRTSGIQVNQAKAVGTLIVVEAADRFRLYQNSACKKVGSTSAARACLAFWGTTVYADFDGQNVAAASRQETIKQKLVDLLSEAGGPIPHGFTGNDAPYAGVLVQASEDGALAYHVLLPGRYVVPEEVFGAGLVELASLDGDPGLTGEEAERWSLGMDAIRDALAAYTTD